MRSFDGYLDPRPPALTVRVLEALRYLSHGLEQEQIADAMGIGAETVKSHLEMARLELRAKTSCHAACIALRLGLID